MDEMILHHYPTSPYSEKIRLIFGLKGVAWRSVTIPQIMPKPDVIALTGGYRRTPIMQIGADIYCDTACIAREIDRRYPQQPLYPSPEAETIASWAEAKTFGPAVGVAFAHIGDTLPQEFKDDRAKFSGRDFNPERMRLALPYMQDQVRSVLVVLDEMLKDGRPFLLGSSASIADFGAYHPLWFIVSRVGRAVEPLDRFARLLEWMARIKAIGHGKPTDMSSKEAIDAARASKPAPALGADPQDPAQRKPGDRLSVMPDDTGREPMAGELVGSSAREIVIRRTDERAGTVHVHFPRLGYMVMPAK